MTTFNKSKCQRTVRRNNSEIIELQNRVADIVKSFRNLLR